MANPAVLVLEDGTIYRGVSIGVDGSSAGEVVFNTAMTGYQEILTDPSYTRQLVTLTYPHIGNTGTASCDAESEAAQVAGLIIRDLPLVASNWRNELGLGDWLEHNRIVAISEIDTRSLTRHIRHHGAMAGCIEAGESIDVDSALAKARSFPGLSGMDLAQLVSCQSPYTWQQGSWDVATNACLNAEDAGSFHVVAMDFGIKRNILRMLVDRGCHVTVVPASTTAKEILNMQPDGVFLSNGPGDPEPCDYAVSAITQLLLAKVPLFGICLGHQLLALASGASTVKMKFGHHGANHPVLDAVTGQVMISSQNHGFAVDPASLPPNVEVTHTSLFDGSLQGIRRNDVPAFGFQGHPEASPGPHDVAPVFNQFIDLMTQPHA